MVFGPKPEVLPVCLRDPDQSLQNQSRFISILILIIFIKNFGIGSALGLGSLRDPGPGIDFWTQSRNRDRLFKTGIPFFLYEVSYILCDGRFFRWHIQNFFGSGPQKLFLCNQTLKNLTCFAFILDASSGYYQIQKKRKEKFLEEYKRENVGSQIFPYYDERLNKLRNHLRKNQR